MTKLHDFIKYLWLENDFWGSVNVKMPHKMASSTQLKWAQNWLATSAILTIFKLHHQYWLYNPQGDYFTATNKMSKVSCTHSTAINKPRFVGFWCSWFWFSLFTHINYTQSDLKMTLPWPDLSARVRCSKSIICIWETRNGFELNPFAVCEALKGWMLYFGWHSFGPRESAEAATGAVGSDGRGRWTEFRRMDWNKRN